MISALVVNPEIHLLIAYAIFIASYTVFAIGRFPGTKIDRPAAAIQPYDTYQIVETTGSIVTVWHATSQDHRSMDKAQFQASKEAVLRWIGDLIGADPTELRSTA